MGSFPTSRARDHRRGQPRAPPDGLGGRAGRAIRSGSGTCSRRGGRFFALPQAAVPCVPSPRAPMLPASPVRSAVEESLRAVRQKPVTPAERRLDRHARRPRPHRLPLRQRRRTTASVACGASRSLLAQGDCLVALRETDAPGLHTKLQSLRRHRERPAPCAAPSLAQCGQRTRRSMPRPRAPASTASARSAKPHLAMSAGALL